MASSDTGTSSGEVTGGGTWPSGVFALKGFNFRETAGSTATVELHDGTSTAGARKVSMNLAANESVEDSFKEVIEITSGHIYVSVVSGTVRWIVYYTRN